MYSVIVGNIGTVYDGTSLLEANKAWGEYKRQSKEGYETVTMMRNGEPVREYVPPVKVPPIGELTRLIRSLKRQIRDDYRVEGQEEEDTVPRMCVTIGCTVSTGAWDYQTGDNSYSGGAYGHRYWAVVDIHRRSNSRDIAIDIREQLREVAYS